MNDYLFESTIEEAYIGKSETLQQIEKQLQIIHDTVKRGQDINSKPEVQKLNRLIEKQFGMDIFSLRVLQEGNINAYTMVIGTKFDIGLEYDMRDLVIGSQDKGYRFKDNNNLCIITCISLGLLTHPEITGEELTGILLHEIGHNFADCLDNSIRLANRKIVKNYYQYCILKASIIFGRKYKKELEQNTNKYERKQSEKESKHRILRGWIRGLAALKYNFSSFCGQVISKLIFSKFRAAKYTDEEKNRQEDKIKKDLGRKNEVFADKFAAIYGYGGAVAKGLYKMDTNLSKADKFLDKIFGQSVVDNYNKLYQDYFLYDVHPHTIQRANSMMNSLKTELAKEDLDPKMKEVIKKQLEEMEKFVKEITTACKNDSERQAVRKAFYNTVNEKSPDALAKELEDEIEKELDEALKKNK